MKAMPRCLGTLAIALVMSASLAGPASADWTLGAYLGGARTQSTSLTVTQPSVGTDVTLSPVHYRSESFEPPYHYGYRVGVFPGSRSFGIEGEFIHLKVIADTSRTTSAEGIIAGRPTSGARPLSSVVERFSISHGVNLLLVNAVIRRTAAIAREGDVPRWILTGRAGVGASVPHSESTTGGLSLERYEWGSVSLQAAAGVEVRIARRLFIAGEYKLTRTAQDVSIVGGSARTPLTTHHLVSGVVVHMGR
jgi:opacity protein-like surface antigen